MALLSVGRMALVLAPTARANTTPISSPGQGLGSGAVGAVSVVLVSVGGVVLVVPLPTARAHTGPISAPGQGLGYQVLTA